MVVLDYVWLVTLLFFGNSMPALVVVRVCILVSNLYRLQFTVGFNCDLTGMVIATFAPSMIF